MSTNGAPTVRRRSGRRAEGGFTLIETCISLLIMMIAGLGVATLFTFSVSYNQGASDRARAYAVAQQKMELVRSTPYDNLTAAFATANTGYVQEGSAGSADLRRFSVTMSVTTNEVVIDGAPRRKTITVTVAPQKLAATRWGTGAVTLITSRASSEMGPN